MASPDESGVSTAAFYDATTLDPDVARRRTDELAGRLAWSRESILAFQQDRLREILRHAVDASPFYRDKIGHLVASGAPFSAFPTMDKTILMAEFDGIVTDRRLRARWSRSTSAAPHAGHLLMGKYRVAATGGSSGRRGIFVYDQEAWELTIASLRRMQRLIGVPSTAKALGIVAPSPVQFEQPLLPPRRASVIRMLLASRLQRRSRKSSMLSIVTAPT